MTRSSLTAALALALLLGTLATSSANAATAHTAGGDVVELTYPSIVKARVDRTERALRRATRQIEDGNPAKAASTLRIVRRQLSSAWRGAKYVIRSTPPPPAEEAQAPARLAGDGPTGPTLASPADTGMLVLTLQHDVAAAAIDLLEDADAGTLSVLGTTLSFAIDRRVTAMNDILALAPPAPAEEAAIHAHSSGDGPVVTTFDQLMPNVLAQLDDELQAIQGMKSEATYLPTAGRQLLEQAETKISASKAFVNAHWPPVPPED